MFGRRKTVKPPVVKRDAVQEFYIVSKIDNALTQGYIVMGLSQTKRGEELHSIAVPKPDGKKFELDDKVSVGFLEGCNIPHHNLPARAVKQIHKIT